MMLEGKSTHSCEHISILVTDDWRPYTWCTTYLTGDTSWSPNRKCLLLMLLGRLSSLFSKCLKHHLLGLLHHLLFLVIVFVLDVLSPVRTNDLLRLIQQFWSNVPKELKGILHFPLLNLRHMLFPCSMTSKECLKLYRTGCSLLSLSLLLDLPSHSCPKVSLYYNSWAHNSLILYDLLYSEKSGLTYSLAS